MIKLKENGKAIEYKDWKELHGDFERRSDCDCCETGHYQDCAARSLADNHPHWAEFQFQHPTYLFINLDTARAEEFHLRNEPCEQEVCQECCGEYVGHEYDADEGGYCLNCEAHPND